MPTDDQLVLEVLDYDWNRLYVTPHVKQASITEELGAVGEGEVTLPAGDPVILYLPDPANVKSNEGRWRLYESGSLVFAGVVDQTTRRISEDNTYTFGGKQRGILLGNANMGRRNFKGWPVQRLFEECLRDNIAKAPVAHIEDKSSAHPAHPAINCITGDIIKNNFWASNNAADQHFVTIDLGDSYDIVGVRVIAPWWDNKWYNFRVLTSDDDSTYADMGGYETNRPLDDKGKLVLFDDNCRYVKVRITDSSDNFGRLAAVLVYTQLAEVGADTDYLLPWIENDDSGNVTRVGDTDRRMTNGAFNGDGVLGNSFTTRLNPGGSLHHRFRGTDSAVYFTQGKLAGAAEAEVFIDNVSQGIVSIPDNSYQYEGFKIEGLSNGEHHMKVAHESGDPQVDYFAGLYESSYRPIRDDDSQIGYYRGWQEHEGENFTNFVHHRSSETDAIAVLENFIGDSIKVIGTTGPNFGRAEYFIDGNMEQNVNLYTSNPQYQQAVFTWSGSYGNHDLVIKVKGTNDPQSDGYRVDVDEIRGNFAHLIYMRSYYETNLRMLTRLSEITQSYLRFNHDGSVDLLGKVGQWSETIVREGENEGGSIIGAEVQDDYSETCSAVLALASNPDGLPVKAFVIDRKAVDRMGLKVRKVEFADANDAYLLTRQAWSELQDHAYPERRYDVQWDPELVGNIQVGQTTVLYAPNINLSGSDQFRVGRLVTDFDTEEATSL